MRQQPCVIPEGCQLDLWAKVIIAKDVQCNEPILGDYSEYGEPGPFDLVVSGLGEGEEVTCIEDFKVEMETVSYSIICTTQVNVSMSFTAYFWVRTTAGFECVAQAFDFDKQICVDEFIKADGTPLTPAELRAEVDQAEVLVQNYVLRYVNVLPPDPYVPDSQIVQVILSADIITKVGKYRDVIVYGVLDPTICPDPPIDLCPGLNLNLPQVP